MKEAFSFVRTPDFHTLENWNYYFVFYNIYTMYTVFIKKRYFRQGRLWEVKRAPEAGSGRTALGAGQSSCPVP